MTDQAIAKAPANIRFGIGRAMSLTLNVLWRRFWLLAPVAVVACAPMFLLLFFWQPGASAGYVWALKEMPLLRFVQLSLPATSVPFATSLILTALFTRPVLSQLEPRLAATPHRPGTIARAVSLALTVGLFSAIYWLGHIFYEIPALVVCVFFWVVMPVAVVEDASPTEALRRSIGLVRGHFVAGFALLAGYAGAFWLCTKAIEDLYRLGFVSRVTGPVFIVVLTIGYFLVGSILDNVAYYLLRREKEGITTSDVGDVFD
jgi:hypothetical protein